MRSELLDSDVLGPEPISSEPDRPAEVSIGSVGIESIDTEAIDPEAIDPDRVPELATRRSAGERLAIIACVAGLVEALLLAVSGTGLLLISGLAGGLGADTLPTTSPTRNDDRHELWIAAGFTLAAMMLTLVGALLLLTWTMSRRRLGKILLTWAVAILIIGSFLQTQINDLSVSRWWTGALIGLAVLTTGLAWLSALASRGK